MATNNIKSGKYIQTLEHLDGKVVKYSTITTQFPDIFVQRKRNTGELIISTDTDPNYGMHHIYAGGEHIASGYGFATIKTRDDLTYIQETYTGVFNYLNNGYLYHNAAYTYMTDFANKSYTYVLQSLLDNSYTNVCVDPILNNFTIGNTTYVLEAANGTLYIKTDDKISIYPQYSSINEGQNNYDVVKNTNSTYVLLSNDFNDIITQTIQPDGVNNNSSLTFGIGNTINNIEYTTVKLMLKFQQLTNMNFGINNIIKLNYKIYDNIINTSDFTSNTATNWTCDLANSLQFENKNSVQEILSQNKIPNDDTITSITIPVFKNYNASLDIEYTLDDITTLTTEKIYFKWTEPIIIFNVKTEQVQPLIEKTNIDIINNINEQKYALLSYPYKRNTNFIMEYSNDKDNNNTIMIVPSDNNGNKKYDFYISTDVEKKANCEGGFACGACLPSKGNENNNTNKYNIYVSEQQLENQALRFDIDIK